MIVTYLRSSGYNTYSFCGQQFFINYVLGWNQQVGKKAEKGTIVHKIMECIAAAKQCVQNKQTSFVDKDIGLVVCEDIFTDAFVNDLAERCYEFYTSHSQITDWVPLDKKHCAKWTWKALHYNNGMMDPRNLDIVCPELKFDFEIKKKWAEYYYVHPKDNEVLHGNLALKGTIDLVTKVSDKVYEITDYKTTSIGRKKDWISGKEKGYKELHEDPQLRIYHYAVHQMYPDLEQVIVTINFINDGGPYTICFDKSEIEKTEEMIRIRFEQIKRDMKPQLLKRDRWKCNKICYFGKTQHPKDKSKTICQYIHDLTKQKGIDYVTKTQTVDGHDVGHYEEPGGVSE